MKQMRKRTLAALTALTISLGAVPAGAVDVTGEMPDIFQVSVSDEDVLGDGSVTPQTEDFEIEGTTLKGLKSTYVTELTDEQKQNIRLVIPSSVTVIAERAFQNGYGGNKDCRFISLDISEATSLKSIGLYGFAGNTAFTGDLTLPDSLESMGNAVFEGCTGFDGTLTLPNNPAFTAIPNQTFYHCGFTGTLTIPEQIKSIGTHAFNRDGSNGSTGFTGEIYLPDAVETVNGSAFYKQNGITSVRLSSNITALNGQIFYGCTNLEEVIIPESSQLNSLTGQIFSYSGLKSIVLPKGVKLNSSNTFSSCGQLQTIICADKNDYDAAYAVIGSSDRAKLTYLMEVRFDDGAGGTYDTLIRLYNKPLNMVKGADGQWFTDSAYRLPAVKHATAEKPYVWSFTQQVGLAATESSNATKSTLYAIVDLGEPTITFGPDIDKEYDGTPSLLTVTADHPLYKNGETALGNVVFNYTWYWNTIGSTPAAQSGLGKNQYDVGSIRAPYPISCYVVVQACLVRINPATGNLSAAPFYQVSHSFGVNLRPGMPVVKPECQTTGLKPAAELPELRAGEGSAAGTIVWDEGQTLAQGTHDYRWTFTPDKNEHGMDNYTVLHGTTALTASSSSGSSSSTRPTVTPPKTETTTEGSVTTETTTTTTTNADGSKTTEKTEVATNAATGETTESKVTETVAKDGSVTRQVLVTETAADGAKVQTKTTVTTDAKTGITTATEVVTDAAGAAGAKVETAAETKTTVNAAGVAETTVDAVKTAKLIERAAAAAKALQQTENVAEVQTVVTIRAEAKGAAKTVEVSVPKEAAAALAQGGVQVKIDTPAAAVTLDQTAMQTVSDAAGESAVVIRAEAVQLESLPEAAQHALPQAAVVDLTIRAGENKVSAFGGGTVTVSVPYVRKDSTKNVAVFHVDDAGKLSRMQGAHYDAAAQSVAFATRHFSHYAVIEQAPLPFADVRDSDWHYDAVHYATMNRLFSGVDETHFAPQQAMTRGMLATVLYRMAGSPAAGAAADFRDVSADAYYADAVAWAAASGIVKGYADAAFRPDDPISREQMAEMLYRYAAYKGQDTSAQGSLSAYADAAQVSDYAAEAMGWLVQAGVLQGSGGRLTPQSEATRAEVAALLQRFAANGLA